ncbi:hypothetical protein WJ50_13560 [Burkholderia ubonensis]|nr:hypothetical protein WJ49_23430 [Burkholderia ubonensis]KVL73312.1 hypothetical protein WJ48_01125 [Burkholderia ubonensis]KVL91139.1 hypothetical protein WJ50_13560 [Burkholderia ubonensis]
MAVGAVVGVSILALPAMTAREAGPAALLSWLGMALLSIPIVLCIAELAARQPTAGGVLDYVSSAFGERASTALGIAFLGTIPIGMPVISIIGARYAVHAAGLPIAWATWLAFGAAAIAVFLNALGVKLAGRIQVVVVVLVVALVVVCTSAAIPLVDRHYLVPFSPAGNTAIVAATVPIFFSFVGWEMVAPMAEEFRNPARDLRRSLLIAVAIVGVMYLAFAFVTISTGVYRYGDGIDSFSALAEKSLGKYGLYATTFLACLVAYASLHINVAGFSRMLYSQAREGRLPTYFAKVSVSSGAPVPALALTLVMFTFVFTLIGIYHPDLGFLVKWPATVFIFAYLFTTAAGFQLLRENKMGRALSAIGFALCAIAFVSSGWLMLFPLGLFAAGYFVSRRSGSVAQAIE